jgi:uroporphyrin-3 C-methyltransferase
MENQITPESDHEESRRPLPWKGIGICLTFFAIGLLLVVFYMSLFRILTINKNLAKATVALNTTAKQNQNDISSLQKNLSDMQQKLQQSEADFTSQQAIVADLKKSYQSKSDDWAVADAQYLVKIANANMEIGDNVAMVLRLLQTANQELQNLTDPKVIAIRKALAQDILSLQAVPAQDLTDIYLQINALNSQLDQLPLVTPRPACTPAPVVNDAHLPWWKRGWQTTLTSLQKIVVVRYNQPGVRPFILPEEQDFLFQNIHAMFEQAMSAVVHRQAQIYRASLAQAQEWIAKYFQPTSPLTQTQLKALEKLQAVNLRPTLPAITAVQAFQDYSQTSAAASGESHA